MLGSFFATAFSLLGILGLFTWVPALLLNVDLSARTTAEAVLNLWPLCMFFGGLAMLCSALSRRQVLAIAIPGAVLVAMYFVNGLGNVVEKLKDVRPFTIFYYYGSAMEDGIEWGSFGGVTLAALALVLLAVLVFSRYLHVAAGAIVPPGMDGTELSGLLLRARGLAVLRGVLGSPAARDFLALLTLLAAARPEPAAVAETFGRLWEELATESGDLLPDTWRSHLVGRLLDHENPFSLAAEREELATALVEQTRRDLRSLQSLFYLEAKTLLGLVEATVPELEGAWVPWWDPEPAANPSRRGEPRRVLARKLAAAEDWGVLVETLAEHHAAHGAGLFGRYGAFRWENGGLKPVPRPDPVHLTGLIGYEKEREPLLRNTERLLAGLPSHHALLYGLPGTGKSSTIKAVLNEYADKGLRLVELAKEELKELPLVLDALRGRGPRFILFVDDLSFEEHEVEYKFLKALLEGSIEEPPKNVRLYATSNRRNLIRERFSERDETDDVHARDTMQEKLSLAARFGLRITFPPPGQRRYLEIVFGLVKERGLKISGEELKERALLWDRWHAERSGRTARQFVDELEAELADVREDL